jgi:oxalate decarboxylase/phosphoglucose isomerase-like protein (cupin superfamily)
MKVYFYDREMMRKELKNKTNQTVTVRFKAHTNVIIPKNILEIIQNISKKDRTFMKKLLSTENNLIFFLTNFIKNK